MKDRTTIYQRIAARLAAHAARILPSGRAEWARAMQSEVEHLPTGAEALRWALGCVVASYTERISHMTFGTLRVSRWVLGLEMIMCFMWLGLMFVALATRGLYFGFTGLLPMDEWFFTMLSVTAVGPIGFIVAFRLIVLGRRLVSPVTKVVLCILAAWPILAFAGEILNRGGWLVGRPGAQAEALGLMVLFAFLPALGIAHLVYLSRAESGKAIAA
jgi:hypothetical protein